MDEISSVYSQPLFRRMFEPVCLPLASGKTPPSLLLNNAPGSDAALLLLARQRAVI